LPDCFSAPAWHLALAQRAAGAVEAAKKVVQVLPRKKPRRKAAEAAQKLLLFRHQPPQAAEAARKRSRVSQRHLVAEAAANSAVCTINALHNAVRLTPPATKIIEVIAKTFTIPERMGEQAHLSPAFFSHFGRP
jgi:hypothetical protein